MKLTENFTLEELIATSYKVNNNPTLEHINHLKEIAETLQSIRNSYGNPIKITSGYRSASLNKLVGGSKTSAHCRGYAADTKTTDMKSYQKAVLKWA